MHSDASQGDDAVGQNSHRRGHRSIQLCWLAGRWLAWPQDRDHGRLADWLDQLDEQSVVMDCAGTEVGTLVQGDLAPFDVVDLLPRRCFDHRPGRSFADLAQGVSGITPVRLRSVTR
jgi:hypothetical protein